jgi:hypothetical protein
MQNISQKERFNHGNRDDTQQNVHCTYSLHTKGTKMLLLTNHRSSKPLALSVWTSQLEWAQSAPTKEHGDRVTSVYNLLKDL